MSEDTHAAGPRPTGREYWEDRYRESERIWSGEPNAALVAEVGGVQPGTALDLGCGEGGDAVWLARRGWRVTAVDISEVALQRARDGAARSGVADRVDTRRHDLAESFPQGSFDLVSACFLHSREDMPRERILRTAASRVAPGGLLLVVGHAGHAHWEQEAEQQVALPTPPQVLEALHLPQQEWQVQRAEEREREHASAGGHHADSVVKLRRR
ncbi:SAM-dependent methyltransferase [Streptomonospora litoralis]|uniref:Tellurite resistance protein TehB n=1 Tax=Streptomonospora litoralis TaxID=2498135 RepID=A0A4P6Q4S3_9ACTN|nr:class I SAM-dependent methyltransferase [Streptomonospora litoralis]QBI54341.1 tellurite resistance protein TehB [Streptomonospora litoralis]